MLGDKFAYFCSCYKLRKIIFTKINLKLLEKLQIQITVHAVEISFDIFKPGIETYRKNFPKVKKENVVCEDASVPNVVEKFQNTTSLKKGDVDIIIGGPPCQGFSTMGRIKMASLVKNGQRKGNSDARFINDKRNHLYKSFVRFVDKFKPKAIVMENVLGMVSYKNGAVVKQIIEDFKEIGYPNVDSKVLNALIMVFPNQEKEFFLLQLEQTSRLLGPRKRIFQKMAWIEY